MWKVTSENTQISTHRDTRTQSTEFRYRHNTFFVLHAFIFQCLHHEFISHITARSVVLSAVAHLGAFSPAARATRVRVWRIFYSSLMSISRSRGSSVSIVSDYGMYDLAIGVRSPVGPKIFPLAFVFRPALGPTKRPVQWVPGVLSPG
jgi:hypothetical protein